MFYSVIIPRYQPGVGLSPGGAEPADHGWESLQSRSDTIITCLGAGTQLWGCHRSNSSWQRTVLFAWLFSPASFRFQRLGIQSSGIPEIKVLLLPRPRLARNCSRQQCQAGWIWNQNLPFLSSAQKSWKCQGFAQNSNKTTAGRVGVLQKGKYSPENGVVLFAKHFVSLYWMTSEHWLLFGACCETEKETENSNNGIAQLRFPKGLVLVFTQLWIGV